jgi:anaerobic glycerol-3-phosphate dehydrogenase C subunit
MPLLYDSVKKAAQLDEKELLEIGEKLRSQIHGEVRVDRYARLLYSTDASMYQMEPVGVVIPRSAEDVQATILVANEYGVPVLPRGGGTGLAGQTCNHAIVMDFSKYMRQVLEVHPEERWARVQPGIVNNHLSKAVSQYGLMYAPDPVTSARATVGGGIGNNSCGSHSVIYGKTLDHILEIDAVLSDGSRVHFSPTGGEELERRMSLDTLEGRLYREVRRIAYENKDEVIRRFPKILRRVSGYNLDDFLTDAPMNLTRVAVGSEGTLVVATEAKVNLVPVPIEKGLAAVHFYGLIEAMEATVAILEHGPSAVELVGSIMIRNCRENYSFRHLLEFTEGEPENLIIVEFYGDTEAEVVAKLTSLKNDLEHKKLGYATVTTIDPAVQRLMWGLREQGLGLSMAMKGDAKPLPYVEDTAVSPEKLPEYVARFDQITSSHGVETAYYGHASTGCLHIRPIVNLKTEHGLDTMEAIANEISDLVLEFGGSLSGEHGDGIVRGVFMEKMFGSELYGAFKDLKRAFDPDGLMNPGKIIETPGIRENLRISPATKNIEVSTYLDFSKDGGLDRHIEMCNGQGACRRMEGGMCPSYMVTKEEEHSTRGRANLLRMIMSGLLPASDLEGKRLKDALDLCIECKACKAECPSNVDMAKMKSEMLTKYHERHGVPLRSWLFGEVAMLSKIGSLMAPFSNIFLSLPPVKMLADRFGGIHSKRPLPKFATQTFSQWMNRHPGPTLAPKGEIVYFNDTFTEYWQPEVGKAAIRILEALGYRVSLVSQKRCCGRPLISKGQLGKAKIWAKHNVDALVAYAHEGIMIVGTEPSCLLTLRDEYPDLLRSDEAKAVADKAFMLDELLAKLFDEDPGIRAVFKNDVTANIQVHGHCHQKALIGAEPTLAALRMIPGYDVELIDTGCCGMAGTFGFEKEHYDISRDIGALKLFPAVEAPDREDWSVAVSGISCRQQIGHFTSKRPRHVVEYLADALK